MIYKAFTQFFFNFVIDKIFVKNKSCQDTIKIGL